MVASVQPSLKVFISYSHRDSAMKEEIDHRLRSGLAGVEILSDFLLEPGSDWSRVLTAMRNEADVFLLLVSEAYLHSATVHKVELPQILKRGEEGLASIIPVILENCKWKNREFGKFQALPKFGKPVNEFENKEEAYTEIINALMSIVTRKLNIKAFQIIRQEKETKTGELKLSECNLSSIPMDLLGMPWLKQLDLSKNYIKKIEHLDHLPDLESLVLVKNEIEKLENISSLKKLSYLDLEYNKISVIEGLHQNLDLKVLGLSSNVIVNLSGIEHLQKLETLYAGHNQLKEISVLEYLPKLKRIVLTNNQIQSIKPLLHHIHTGLPVAMKYSYDNKEEGIFIKDNKTLSEPSIEVIEKGRDAILKYFRDAISYGTRKLEVVKLILVGNSKVGKTNLSEFLRGLTITPHHNSTHLLEIQSWEADFLTSANGKPMLVNIFDFGGQDYYHDSHRMYYSHDTSYILLWDTGSNRYSEETEETADPDNTLIYENYPLEYWLESINYNLADKFRFTFNPDRRDDTKTNNTGNSAPVLILQNKIDIEEGSLDQKTLSDKYQNISGFFNLSLKSPKRTKILQEIMSDYMKALDLSGRQLISYEHDIIENYLNTPRAFRVLTLDEFHQDCLLIINNPSIPFDKENAQIVAEILNAIGIIFYDKQSSSDGIIFTQIRRLNEIIKEVMDVAKKGNDKGIFNINQLQQIQARDHILDLLVRNKSIIQCTETEFLVPQFLPVKPDPSVAFFLFAFTFSQVRFIYKAYFHKSVLLSLFAKYLKGTLSGTKSTVKSLPFWRNGIIISKGEGNTREMVLVVFEKTEKMGIINIRTMAPFNKRGLEKDIENTLDELNKGWTVSKEISVNGIEFFDVKKLKEEVKALRFEFSMNGKIFTINDFRHITDFEKLPKKLFISYSSKNAEFIKRFVTHLEVLKSAGLIDPWYDRMIESGTKWDDTIREEMRSSDVVIFLLSPDFLATEYIMKTEIPLAIKQMNEEKSKFFFIELQPCGWKRTEIAKYQQTDDPAVALKNIIQIGQPENDAMWNLVIDELEKKMNT